MIKITGFLALARNDLTYGETYMWKGSIHATKKECVAQTQSVQAVKCTLAMQGRRLSQVHRMFPTGLVLGVYNRDTEQTMLNPPAARRIQPGDYLVMMRPTSISPEDYTHTSQPVPIDLGSTSCMHIASLEAVSSSAD